MASSQTGEYTFILEWFKANPGVWYTPKDIAGEFGISPIKASNALGHWTRRNLVFREEKREGIRERRYRLAMLTDVREEFKVARVEAKPIYATPTIHLPVLVEFDKNRLGNGIKSYLTGIPVERIQALDENAVIIWNSAEQLRGMREMALSL